MSYITTTRRNPASVVAVVAVHAAIGYAFVSGLAMRIVRDLPVVTLVTNIADTPPPPPPDVAKPQPQPRDTLPDAPPTTPADTIVELPPIQGQVIVPIPPQPQVEIAAQPRPDIAPPPPMPSRAREATPRSNRAGWVTTEDYPAAALRDGAEGTTAIRVVIGADGRVGDCTVTASSGNALLDQATCRTYRQRARFTPALDGAGHPVAATRADRVTWRMPR